MSPDTVIWFVYSYPPIGLEWMAQRWVNFKPTQERLTTETPDAMYQQLTAKGLRCVGLCDAALPVMVEVWR